MADDPSQVSVEIERVLRTVDAGCPAAAQLLARLGDARCRQWLDGNRYLRLLFEDAQRGDNGFEDLERGSLVGLVNLAAVAGLVRDLLEQASEETQGALADLEGLQDFAISRLLEECEAQTRAIVRLVDDLVDTLCQLDPARVLVLNLPVGNTIPSRVLLARARAAGLNAREIVQSLTRNPTPSKGPSRREQLERAVRSEHPGARDVVVYVDEWLTGSNFRELTKDLKKICNRAGTRLLTAALVAEHAEDYSKWDHHCHRHNGVLSVLGLTDGARFRVVVPGLARPWPSDRPFFWSEHDRLAGFRKVSIWGAAFTVLERTVRELLSDPEATTRIVEKLARENGLNVPTGQELRAAALAMYRDGYADFLVLREALEDMPDPSGGTGEVTNSSEIERLLARVAADFNLEQRPAKVCLSVATELMKERGFLRAEGARERFRLHTPSLVPTDGGVLRLHEEVVRRIAALR